MNITWVTDEKPGRILSAAPAFRWFVLKDGTRVLQQAWRNVETGEVEWVEVETVHEQA